MASGMHGQCQIMHPNDLLADVGPSLERLRTGPGKAQDRPRASPEQAQNKPHNNVRTCTAPVAATTTVPSIVKYLPIDRQVLAAREVDDRQLIARVWQHSVRYDAIELEELVPDVVRKSWGHRLRRELRPSSQLRALRHLHLHVTLGIVRPQLAAPRTSTISGHNATSVQLRRLSVPFLFWSRE